MITQRSYGGSAFTLNQNENIPLDEAYKIEKAYKELHAGIYKWGEKKFKEILELGYIESAAGFKLHLPYFNEFRGRHKKITLLDRDFWKVYSDGKKEHKLKIVAEENKEDYKIKNVDAYALYQKHKWDISQYYKKKAEYFKLTLNNPVQASSAHQTKEAACRIFEYIEEHNHFWKAKLSNLCHDEVNMEVEDELVEEYITVIETSMKEGGDKYLTKGLFKMDCEAIADMNWYLAK